MHGLRVAAWLALIPGVAFAQSPEGKPKRLTLEQTADAVRAAVASADDAALKRLVSAGRLDPWILTDLLCARGEANAATAYVNAVRRRDTKELHAYIASWRGRKPDEDARAILKKLEQVRGKHDFAQILRSTSELTDPLDTVTRLRLGVYRGSALLTRSDRDKGIALLRAVIKSSRELGWHQNEMTTAKLLGTLAGALKDEALTLETWNSMLAAGEAMGNVRARSWAQSKIGGHYQRKQEHAKAIPHFEKALADQADLKDVGGQRAMLGSLGACHYGLKQYAKARDCYARVVALSAPGDITDFTAKALQMLARSHDKLKEQDEALAMYERARAAFTKLGDEWNAAIMTRYAGHIHRQRREFAKAMEAYQRALRVFEAKGEGPYVTNTLASIGKALSLQQKYAEADAVYKRALAGYRRQEKKSKVAETLYLIAAGETRLARWDDAIAHAEAASTLYKSLGRESKVDEALFIIAGVRRAQGDIRAALKTQERVLARRRSRNDKLGIGMSLLALAELHRVRGAFGKSQAALERAARHLEAANLSQLLFIVDNLAGMVALELGDIAEALLRLEAARTRATALKQPIDLSTATANMGLAYLAIGDYEKALATFRQARANLEGLSPRDAAVALNNVGRALGFLGRHEEALQAYEQSRRELEPLGAKEDLANVLSNVGIAHVALGHKEKGIEALTQALAAQRAGGFKTRMAKSLLYLGRAHRKFGDRKAARDAFEKSARTARSIRAGASELEAYSDLAALHLENGDTGQALSVAEKALGETESLFGGLGEEQGAMARETHADLFAIGALAAVLEDDIATAFLFLESGRAGALLDVLGKRAEMDWKAESLPPELLRADESAQETQVEARIRYNVAVRSGKRTQMRRASEELDKAIEGVRAVTGRIQRQLKRQAGLFYPRPSTIEDVRDALSPNQALVVYGLCRDEALAIVLQRDSERVVRLGPATAVREACLALEFTDPATDHGQSLDALRALIVRPLKLDKSVTSVLVSPEGVLCYVPFGALFDRPVVLTPSGTTHVLLRDQERDAGKGVLALGDPDYGGDSDGATARGRELAPLPATRKEVEAVGTHTLLGGKATEAGLIELAGTSSRWRAVHLACHGLIDVERPMLSSLALTPGADGDGYLTALEVLRLKLPADLAVLSACETGKGKVVKGEGIIGMTRAFMFAGAPRVICSLWKVDDEATQALMIKFYGLWNPKDGSQGLGAAAALRKAQEHIRGQAKWRHPYYWAAWVLWGLPR